MSHQILSWDQQFQLGRDACLHTPWTSLRGKSDVFRQRFYEESSAQLLTGYTHRITAEKFNESINMWVKIEFSTTRDAVKRHLKALHGANARNIRAYTFKKA